MRAYSHAIEITGLINSRFVEVEYHYEWVDEDIKILDIIPAEDAPLWAASVVRWLYDGMSPQKYAEECARLRMLIWQENGEDMVNGGYI